MSKKQSEEKTEEKTQAKKLSQSDFEKRVVALAEKGFTSEKIGETLRKEKIHPKDYEKKISKILQEKNMYVNPDLKNVETKLQKIGEHFEKNKQDKRALREKTRIFSQLRKLKKYHGIPVK